MRLLAAIVVCAGPLGAARGEPIDPKLALLAATQAYTTEPFAERMRIYVGAQPWEGRSEWAVVRCDPRQRSVRFDLGALEVSLHDGRMVAVRRDNQRDCFVRAYEAPLDIAVLWNLMPPVPAPGLTVALADELSPLAPYAQVAEWTDADLSPSGRATITGVLRDGGEITVHLERSGRVGDIIAQLDEDRWLSIQVGPAPLPDPLEWGIDIEGRRQVASLADLAPAVPQVRVGDRAPDMFFLGADDAPWRLSTALEEAAGPLALVFARSGASGAQEAGQRAAAILAERGVRTYLATVYTIEGWSPEAVEAGAEQAREVGAAALWSVSPGRTIDLLTPQPAALALIGADGIVRSVTPLMGRTQPELAAAIDAILAADPPGP